MQVVRCVFSKCHWRFRHKSSFCGFRTTLPDLVCVMFWSRFTGVSCSCVIVCSLAAAVVGSGDCTSSVSQALSADFCCGVTGNTGVCCSLLDLGVALRNWRFLLYVFPPVVVTSTCFVTVASFQSVLFSLNRLHSHHITYSQPSQVPPVAVAFCNRCSFSSILLFSLVPHNW